MAAGRTEGRAEGIAEGIAQNNKEKAKLMKEKGLDINLIAEITGLPKKKILSL